MVYQNEKQSKPVVIVINDVLIAAGIIVSDILLTSVFLGVIYSVK